MNYCVSAVSIIILGCLSGIVNSVSNTYSNLMYSSSVAYFHSQQQNFRIKIGDDVTFPCHVNNKGADVITWKNGIRLLTAGPIKVYNEDRLIHRYNGSEITLRDVQPRDEGEYACQLNTMDSPIELVHHLDVLIPPRIVPREAEVSVKAGSRAELECVAHGNPAPTIHWRRLDGQKLEGPTIGSRLSLENVDRGMAGEFMCLAKNGVEDKDEEIYAEIKLQVQYPPEIQVDAHKHYYHPKLEQKSLTISCNVSADPAPDVNWQRGRKVLTQHNHKNKYQMKSEPLGDHSTRMFILMISDIREEDFGNYTCHATNSLGLDKHEIVVSGKPLPPTILPGEVISKTEFRLRWSVHSAFPVWEHNIYYERIIRGQKNHQERGMRCYGHDECTGCELQDSCNMIKDRVEKKNKPNGHGRLRSMDLKDLQRLVESQKAAEKVLVGLVPDSRYRVKIQTMNEFGKSHWSKDFEFDTHGAQTQRPSIFSAFSSSMCVKLASILLAIPFLLSLSSQL